jgi:hypothetical protein
MSNNLKENIFSACIILQLIFAILFIKHRFIKPLASDLMFYLLVASTIISIYMYWQIFTSNILVKSHKIVGGILASLPIVWHLSFLIFMH